MSRWFRLYDDMLDDPKVQLLSPELFKTWVNLLAVASRNSGKLPAVQALAFSLRIASQDMQARLDDLILAGLIDILPDKSLEPHNWQNRQWKSDNSADRVRKHRSKNKDKSTAKEQETSSETVGNVDVTVTATAPETDTETDTEEKGTNVPSSNSLNSTSPDEPEPSAVKSDPVPVTEAFEAYQIMAQAAGLPQPRLLTPGLRKSIGARLREHSIDDWRDALRAVAASDFLRGRKTNFRADLHWIVKPANFSKILAGNYDNRDIPELSRVPATQHAHPIHAAFDEIRQRFSEVH